MKRTIVNPVIKDVATFLQTANESSSKVSEIEIVVMPGGGNILHYHKTYSETFIAVEGDLGIKLKDSIKVLKPGERYTVKPMELHAFFNPTGRPVKFRILIEPGHEGFENSLRILYGLAADGLTDKKSVPKKPYPHCPYSDNERYECSRVFDMDISFASMDFQERKGET
jgi:mannose-6-phosphate isomerase-like protein (cupin superfamily)